MKAVVLQHYGQDLEALAWTEVPEPTCGAHDVLIEVHAAGFNPFDAKLRKGYLQRFYPFSLPHVLGNDFAGVVLEKGAAVWGLEVGDRVYGMQHTMRRGSYAQRLAVDASNVRKMPANLSFIEAASLPMVYETAWVGLVDLALVRANDLLLVHGGAGGVGSATVQLARALGAHVAATCSADAVEFVRGLGASVTIERKTQEFTRVLANVDVVFDPIGGQTNLDSYKIMRRGGRMVVVLREDALELEHAATLCAEHGVRRLEVAFEQRGDVLDYIRPLFEQQVLRPVVTRILDLKDAREAHRASDAGGARGKVVLAVRGAG